MDYDEATKRWASKRLGIPRTEIQRVDLDSRYVEGCPTCGGDEEFEAVVYLTKKRNGRPYRTIEFTDFQGAVREILAEL